MFSKGVSSTIFSLSESFLQGNEKYLKETSGRLQTMDDTRVRQIQDSLLFPRCSARETLWDVDESLSPCRNVLLIEKNCIKLIFTEASYSFFKSVILS